MLEAPDLNYGQIFFMTLGFLPVLACFPCWLVAKFVYEPYLKELEKEEEIIKNEPIPFEYQFPIEKAENTKDKDSDFKNCIVLSNTPKGLVYMRYHKEDEGFEYWTDNAIDYKYLESVARKYVTVFSCRDLYIERFVLLKEKIVNLKEQIEENKRREAEKEENEDEEDEADTDNVFASFKAYNQSTKDKVQKEKTELTRNDVVCDKANKYLHRGKVKEAIFGDKPAKVNKQATSSMSFSSWKLWKSSEDKKDKQI
jgi:hypothetical protein